MTRKRRTFSDSEKLELINEYLSSGESKDAFQKKRHLGHNNLSNWMLTFGISTQTPPSSMAPSKKEDAHVNNLQEEISRLKKELEFEKLRSKAFETMIDIAEEELKINIRKKSGAKQ